MMEEIKDDGYIHVLWVDDDPKVRTEFPREAGMDKYKIYLHPFECWMDAEPELERQFDKIDAIILDAKCKHTKNSNAVATQFLMEALSSISSICSKRNHQIHWYILSGGAAEIGEDIDQFIPAKRLAWDADWEKISGHKYYSKNTDRDALYNRIRQQLSQSTRTQLRTQLYRDVFRAIESCGLHPEAATRMEDILLPMHDEAKGIGEEHLTSAVRKVIEHTFRALIEKWGLLPARLITRTSRGEEINLSYSSILLSGRDVAKADHLVEIFAIDAHVDKIVADNIRHMIKATGSWVHTDGASSEEGKIDFTTHLDTVNKAPYLLRSYAFQLCDFILSVDKLVKDNPDPEANKAKWEAAEAAGRAKEPKIAVVGKLEKVVPGDGTPYDLYVKGHKLEFRKWLVDYIGKDIYIMACDEFDAGDTIKATHYKVYKTAPLS